MPLTRRGAAIMASMKDTYHSARKAKEVFYASRNAGKIKGVDKPRKRKARRKAK
jgi:hypothetical protein